MNKKFLIIAGVAVVVLWAISCYNGLVQKEEVVSKAWSNVETQYQRRSDLIPNLVNIVKGYAAHESNTFKEVVEARSKATSIQIDPSNITPEQLKEYQQAQAQVGSALGRLLAVSENYPELKANEQFKELQAQLEGTENRIQKSRSEFNEEVQTYNVTVRKFPGNIVAMIAGFNPKANFTADEGAQNAPKVQF